MSPPMNARRWVTILAAALMTASACGGDGDEPFDASRCLTVPADSVQAIADGMHGGVKTLSTARAVRSRDHTDIVFFISAVMPGGGVGTWMTSESLTLGHMKGVFSANEAAEENSQWGGLVAKMAEKANDDGAEESRDCVVAATGGTP